MIKSDAHITSKDDTHSWFCIRYPAIANPDLMTFIQIIYSFCSFRNTSTPRNEFIFYSKRLMRMLFEFAMSLLPFKVSLFDKYAWDGYTISINQSSATEQVSFPNSLTITRIVILYHVLPANHSKSSSHLLSDLFLLYFSNV